MKISILSQISIELAVLQSIVTSYIDGNHPGSSAAKSAVQEPANMELARVSALETTGLSMIAVTAPLPTFKNEMFIWKDANKNRPSWTKSFQRDLFAIGLSDACADSSISLTSDEISSRKKFFDEINDSK